MFAAGCVLFSGFLSDANAQQVIHDADAGQPSTNLQDAEKKLEIVAGMPLTLDILGEKRTITNYIITPIQKSLSVAFREQ